MPAQPRRAVGFEASGPLLLAAAAAATTGVVARARGRRAGGRQRCLRQRLRAEELKQSAAVEEVPQKEALGFAAGDRLAAAQRMVQSRVHAVAPWGKDVDPLPIFAVSDRTGNVARRLAKSAFQQFGVKSKSRISVFSKVDSEASIEELVDKAATKENALCLYTLASPKLSAFLESQCAAKGVPCLNLLETTFAVMEKKFDMRRSLDSADTDSEVEEEEAPKKPSLDGLDGLAGLAGLAGLSGPPTIFAVSDSSGETTAAVVRAALDRLPGCGVDTVTVCPRVHTLEEINHIAREAFRRDSLVIFSFASPGMSRFMRQQCERIKVTYADIYQPVVITMEAYFNYPPVGVAGGLDLGEVKKENLKWEEQPIDLQP